MELCLALFASLYITAQVVAASTDDDLVSCSETKLNKIFGMCDSTMCDVIQTKLIIGNEILCGYKLLKYLEQPILNYDPSCKEVERKENELQPCEEYKKTSTLFSKSGKIIEGPYRDEKVVPAKAPPAVENLNVTVSETKNITVFWPPPKTLCKIQGYNFTYKYTDLKVLQDHPQQWKFLQSNEPRNESCQIENIQANALYEICVSAFVGEQKGETLCTKILTPEQATRCSPAPHSVSLMGRNSRSLTITWEPPEGGNKVYKYELSVRLEEEPNAPVTIHSVPSETEVFTIHHLEPGTRHRVAVRAVGDCGPGEEAVSIFTTEEEEEEVPNESNHVSNKTQRRSSSNSNVTQIIVEREKLEELKEAPYYGGAESILLPSIRCLLMGLLVTVVCSNHSFPERNSISLFRWDNSAVRLVDW